MEATQQQLMFVGASLLCAAVGSVHDVLERRIPNFVTFTGIVAGLSLHTIVGGWHGLGDSMLAGLIAGCFCMLFYLAGGMGAGDVKLMTAVGCVGGLASLGTTMIATAAAGAIFAIGLSIIHGRTGSTLRNVGVLVEHHWRKGLKPHPELNVDNDATLRMPFALPVAAGCLFTLCDLALGGLS